MRFVNLKETNIIFFNVCDCRPMMLLGLMGLFQQLRTCLDLMKYWAKVISNLWAPTITKYVVVYESLEIMFGLLEKILYLNL